MLTPLNTPPRGEEGRHLMGIYRSILIGHCRAKDCREYRKYRIYHIENIENIVFLNLLHSTLNGRVVFSLSFSVSAHFLRELNKHVCIVLKRCSFIKATQRNTNSDTIVGNQNGKA